MEGHHVYTTKCRKITILADYRFSDVAIDLFAHKSLTKTVLGIDSEEVNLQYLKISSFEIHF